VGGTLAMQAGLAIDLAGSSGGAVVS